MTMQHVKPKKLYTSILVCLFLVISMIGGYYGLVNQTEKYYEPMRVEYNIVKKWTQLENRGTQYFYMYLYSPQYNKYLQKPVTGYTYHSYEEKSNIVFEETLESMGLYDGMTRATYVLICICIIFVSCIFSLFGVVANVFDEFEKSLKK